MCCDEKKIRIAQFRDIKPEDTDITVNGVAYPSTMKMSEIVANDTNSLYFDEGIEGLQTLHLVTVDQQNDIVISFVRGGLTSYITNSFIGGRPIRRPNGQPL